MWAGVRVRGLGLGKTHGGAATASERHTGAATASESHTKSEKDTGHNL